MLSHVGYCGMHEVGLAIKDIKALAKVKLLYFFGHLLFEIIKN